MPARGWGMPTRQTLPLVVDQKFGGNATSGASLTLTTASVNIGDTIVAFHGAEYDTAAQMVAPTGTAGTWTLITTADVASNNLHQKGWWRTVTAAGAQTVTLTGFGASAIYGGLIVVRNAHSSPISGTPTTATSNTNATTIPGTSLTPGHVNTLLVKSAIVNANITWTQPSGMTKEGDFGVTWIDGMLATLQLTSTAATGTKNSTVSGAGQKYATIMCAIRPAA